MKRIDIDEVKTFIESQSPETKIYIGGDSERFNVGNDWYADYTLVIVVHIDGKLESHEDHFAHKLANLLRLTHKELIDAKLKARTQLV